MDLFSALLIVIGLVLFEAVSGLDNAVINAEVLSGMSQRARRFFLTWGIVFAVFVVRGFLPWLIIYLTVPDLGFMETFTVMFSQDARAAGAITQAAPVLLMGGGVFLLFLFLHWLFLEPKRLGLRRVEGFFQEQGAWFFALVSVILALIVWFTIKSTPLVAFGAVLGSTAFFITHGFRAHALAMEQKYMKDRTVSDLSKILFLEIIDTSFSIDGVLGAFAFTLSVPLILLGNGIGAIIVRELTSRNIERVKRYVYLKNGAMYSIFCLGSAMVAQGFGVHVPEWASPLITIAIIGYFFQRSRLELGTARG